MWNNQENTQKTKETQVQDRNIIGQIVSDRIFHSSHKDKGEVYSDLGDSVPYNKSNISIHNFTFLS